MKPLFAIIGGGTMAEAMVKGLLGKGLFTPEQIRVSDPLQGRREFLAQAYGIQTCEANEDCLEAQTILFAVKPAQLSEVLRELGPCIEARTLVISIVAGAKLASIGRHLKDIPIIRAMPNTPCVIAQGITALAPNDQVQPDQMEHAKALFGAVGEVLELPEAYFDAVTGLSGSGPAYVTLLIEAFIEAGVQQGLPRRIARELVCQTVKGTAWLVQTSGKHPAELKDQVVTPAGTTAAGLQVLEQAAVRATLCSAVRAATERSHALGNE